MGYVYRITNNVTKRWYIGSHNGSKPNYFGSGLLLSLAIKKHGKKNFTKVIIYEGEDFREKEETILKELNASEDDMSYNLKNEALGGTFPGVKNGMYGKQLTEDQRYNCGKAFRGKKRPEHSKRMRGSNNPMYGKNDHAHGLIERAKSQRGKTFDEIHGKEKADEIRKNLSKSQIGKKHKLKLVKCPHCEKSGSGPNMTRYHFNNCKRLYE